jgi:hypothetical protein
MALVRCPECGKTISDEAGACPQCGKPMYAGQGSSKPKRRGCTMWIIIVILVIAAVIGGYIYLKSKGLVPPAVEKAVQSAISGPPAPAQPAPGAPASVPQAPPAPAAPVKDTPPAVAAPAKDAPAADAVAPAAPAAPARPAAAPVVVFDKEINLPIGEFHTVPVVAARPSRLTVTCTESEGTELDVFVLNEANGAKWAGGERTGIEFMPGLSAAPGREFNLTAGVPAGQYSVIIDNTAFSVSAMPAHGQPLPVKAKVTVIQCEE